MRILLVSEDVPYPNMGGLGQHVLNLANALARAGHEVDLLGNDEHPLEVAGAEGSAIGRFFGELNGQHAGWKEISLGMYLPLKRSWIARRFARTIMRHAPNYDVIHYHGHIPNVARFLPQSINFVQTRHDQGSECLTHTRFRNGAICRSVAASDCAACRTRHPNWLQKAVSTVAVTQYRQEVAAGFRRHKTVFVSDMLQHNLSRAFGPGAWGATVHHFVDTASVRRARESAAADTENPGGKRRVFIAAKLYPAKGVGQFLRELAPRMPRDMQVTIAGDGPEEIHLRQEFARDDIRFLGWCSAEVTLRTAASADAIVMPSLLEEAFGAVTLEGLLLGKPTFALAHGATPELAEYAAAPGQLRLHPDMPALVRDLLAYRPAKPFHPPPDGLGGVDQAVRKLLRIYRAPPGQALR
jgi:glycogen synthase